MNMKGDLKISQKGIVHPIQRTLWENQQNNDFKQPCFNDLNGKEHFCVDLPLEQSNLPGKIHFESSTDVKSFPILPCTTFVESLVQKKLHDREILSLREQLEAQLKINSDLKKLLIASIGDDLQCKVDVLVRTKAQLVMEVTSCANRLIEDYENIDKLTIEADLWHSKFQASRILTNFLTLENDKLWNAYTQSLNTLQLLLDERIDLGELLTKTNRHLKEVSSCFDAENSHVADNSSEENIFELAKSNRSLAENIYNLLFGHVSCHHIRSGEPIKLTFAEEMAKEILTKKSTIRSTIRSNAYSTPCHFPNRGEILFNCCKRCRGQVLNV